MTKSFKKSVSLLLSLLILLSSITCGIGEVVASAICCRKDYFDKSKYTLTGNMAHDVAVIAKSQKGRTRADFGYTEGWCDEFCADCIENAGGSSSIVVHGGTVSDFESKMRGKGAVTVTSPKEGDLIFFSNLDHVEIVTKVVNGEVYCAGGNNSGATGGMCKGERAITGWGTARCYLRPNYPSTTQTDTTKPDGTIHSTNNVAASQTVTLDINDNIGLAGYYWGTNSTYSSNTYTSASGKSQRITKTISSAGTYYLRVKDTAGNLSNSVSVTFYKTTLNANGGSVSPSSVITMEGYSFKLPAPTKSGCTFAGWNTNSSGTGTAYAAGATYMPSGSITLYAHWKANCTTHTKGAYQYYWAAHPHYKCYKCTVCGETFPDKSETTYLSSCSTCTTPPDVTVTAGTSLTDTVITFTKNSMASHHDIHIYRPDGSRYKLISGVSSPYSLVLPKGVYSIQVVAVIGENLIWSNAKSVTVNNALIVNYYSNYADKSFADSLNAVGADRNVIVRTATFNAAESYQYGLHDYSSTSSGTYLGRTGYTCTKNWNTKPDGSGISINELTSFSSGQELAQALGKDLSNNNATVDLYPEWKNSVDGPKTYIDKTRAAVGETITLTWDDVPNANINNYWIQCQTEGNSRVIAEINNSKRKQFTINEPGEYSIVVLAITPENITSTSNDWKSFTVYNTYNVTLNSHCNTYPTTSSSVPSDIGIRLPDISHDDLILAGWNTKPDGSGTSYGIGDIFKPSQDITLYAEWELLYTIQYMNYFSGGVTKTDKVTKGYYTISPPPSGKNGYIIPGWFNPNGDLDICYQKGDVIYVNTSIQLLAYDLCENKNPAIGDVNRDGTVSFDDVLLTAREAGSPGTLSELEQTLADVNCDGIVDDSDAGKIAQMCGSDIHTLTYIADEGNNVPQGQTGNGNILLSSVKPTRSGYTFLGWSTQCSATQIYQPGEIFNLTKDTFLVAQWQYGETYTLTYDSNGGNFADLIQTTKGSLTLSSEIPTRTGYNFLGWSTSSSSTTAQYQPGDNCSLTGDMVLYAVWEQELISSGSELTSLIHYDGQIYWYKFTPSISGTYVMYSTGDYDTYGYLYNSSGELVADDDDGGDMFNFRLCQNLTAGNEYFIGVRYYSYVKTGTISLSFGPVYTITYDSNGGSDAPLSQSADWSRMIYLSSYILTRDEYIFLGWSTNSSATTAEFHPGDYILGANLNLYAVWKACEHTFCKVPNGDGTCTIAGTYTMMCSECGYSDGVVYTESEPSHHYVIDKKIDPTCSEEGFIYKICVVCGEEVMTAVPALLHSFTNYIYNNDATTEQDGTETAKCDRCDKTDTRIKPGTKLIPEQPENPTSSAKLIIPANTDVEYSASVTVIAKATGVPSGYYVALYDGGTLLAKGSNTEVSYTIPGEFKSTKNITVKIIDSKGNVQKDSSGKDLTGSVEIKAKSGFFAKLIAFFKRLFKALPSVEVKPK